MAGKAKRDKSKRHLQSKKSRAMLRTATPGQEPATITGTPAVSTPVTAPVVRAHKAAAPKPEQPRDIYIGAELRRIAILAAGIITVLVVLALVLK